MNRILLWPGLTAVLAFAAASTYGQGLNIDFGDDVLGLPSSYAAASGQAGEWNEVFADGTLDGLDGAPTSVFLDLAAGSTSGESIPATSS